MNFKTFAIHNLLRLYKNAGQLAFDNPKLARAAFDKLADFLPGKSADCSYESTRVGQLDAEWIVPDQLKGSGVLYFLHGGGYATGSLKTHRALASQIALATGVRALMLEYSLAPEHQFPVQIEEALQGYQFLLDRYAPSEIVMAGESAGAGLIAGMLLCAKDRKLPMPAAAMLLSPWLDLTASGESHKINKHRDPMVPYKGIPLWAANYAGKENLQHPYASPLFGNLKGLCPLYIQVGETELLLDDSRQFAKKAHDAGVEVRLEVWPHMFHAWQGFWMVLDEGRQANEKLGAYAAAKLWPSSAGAQVQKTGAPRPVRN
ncbi:MAG: alpha/beta hydrolase [Chitinophagales bacterium]